jgi:hypothetical protein
MKLLYYLYYKVFNTFNRIHNIIRLYRGPVAHTDDFVTMFLFSIPLWLTIKLDLWNTTMGKQFALTLIAVFILISFGVFVSKKVSKKATGFYIKETKAQSIIGAVLVNTFVFVYFFLWFYSLK